MFENGSNYWMNHWMNILLSMAWIETVDWKVGGKKVVKMITFEEEYDLEI